jgi:Neuraminidase (sialidase)
MVSFNSPDALHWSSSYNIYNQDPESDKDMIQCDKWPNSPYFGHCYVEWDSGTAYIQTTTDGGQTWSAPQTAEDLEGIGGEPQVLPNGVVCVPINAGFDGTISAMMSSDGGQTFSSSEVADPQVAEDDSGIRNPGMMTAATDAKGTVYIVWSDCRFNSGCNANGLVMSSSTDCINWTPPSQISTTGDLASVDHILPGVGADQGSSAAGGRVGVVYYYFNNSQCNPDCELGVAYVGTKDGGKTWSHPAALGSPFSINWLPNSDLGPMLGDYFAVAFSNGRAFPIVPIALQPDGDTLNQLMYTAQGGIPF